MTGRRRSEPTSGETPDGLAQLATALAQERTERRAIEQALGRARAQLARAQAQLIDTQAGAQRARHLACHDPLTSLPNLRYFQARLKDRLAHALPQGRNLAVLFIDLDGFKQINDQNGHRTGDALLRITAARMRHAVRAADLVSRIGGDEFACLIDGLPSRDQLRHIACKLFGSICAPMMIQDRSFMVRPSIGIALFPDDGSTPHSLLQSADAAMYTAKRQQIGYSFFDAGVHRPASAPSRPQRTVAS
jgi:diguanylate cyclase (GGDEF)-like protein